MENQKFIFHRIIWVFKVLAVSTLIWSRPSFAVELTLFGGASLGTNAFTANGIILNTGVIVNPVGGAGLYVELSRWMGLQLEGYYMKRGAVTYASINSFVYSGSQSVDSIAIPLLAEFTVVPQYFRLGVGPYLGVALGDVIWGDFAIINRSAYGWRSFEGGMAANARALIPLGCCIDIIADLHYFFGIWNSIYNPPLEAKFRDLSLVVGANFHL